VPFTAAPPRIFTGIPPLLCIFPPFRTYIRPDFLPRLPRFLITPFAALTAAPSEAPRFSMEFATWLHCRDDFPAWAFFVCRFASLADQGIFMPLKTKRPRSFRRGAEPKSSQLILRTLADDSKLFSGKIIGFHSPACQALLVDFLHNHFHSSDPATIKADYHRTAVPPLVHIL
jgi:hypothetical protein